MDDVRQRLPSKPTRFIDQLRLHVRNSGLAYQTEKTYIHWVKRFIYFNNKQHPKNAGMKEVESFLSHLANERDCSLNTQRIALNALVYLYKKFLGVDVGQLHFAPAKVHRRLPVVYSKSEITAILTQLRGTHRLLVELMYGTGLRKA